MAGNTVDAPLRVVALIPGDDFSGPAGQVASTAIELVGRGVEVRFALLCRPTVVTGRLPAFLRRHQILCEVVEDRGPLDLRLFRRVRQLLDTWRPQILETHGYKASAIALLLRRRNPQWRWLGFFHGLTSESRRARFYHWLDLRMLGRADGVAVVSDEQRRRILRWAPNARVIHSAVTSLDGTNDGPSVSLDDVPRPRIAVVGRLSPEKGVDVFLRAAALLADRGVLFSALVVGDGPDRTALEGLSTALGIDDRTRFLGRITRMKALYEQIDMLVIPSRSEGLPSVLLEALDADVRVVSTRVGAIPEVLDSPDAGILVQPDSPADLATGIQAGLAHGGSDAARRARRAAALSFSQDHRANALTHLYRELAIDFTGNAYEKGTSAPNVAPGHGDRD
jgi:glycosyltransferase involved in cell wall biosynthesis